MKILGFGFANVFKVAAQNYKALRQEDQYLVNTYLAIIVLLFMATFIVDIRFPTGGVLYVVSILSFSIAIAISFSVFDRLSLLTPIETKIATGLGNLDDAIEGISTTTTKQIEGVSTAVIEQIDKGQTLLEEAIETFRDYGKYRKAKFAFGLNSVVGFLVDENAHPRKFYPEHLGLELLKAAESDWEICYMNTFILDDNSYYNAIKDAVVRGVNVLVLLMKPDELAPVVVARYTDYYQHARNFRSPKAFVDYIKSRYHLIDGLPSEIARLREKNPRIGACSIKYYTKSLNFPMIMVTENRKIGHIPDVVYTGFYAGLEAEGLPYIEWRGGDFQIIKKFADLFRTKWQACTDTFLFEENGPSDWSV